MRFRIMPLEERIVLDAAGIFDILHSYQIDSLAHSQVDVAAKVVAPATSDTHDKTLSLDANAASTTSGIHVLVISSGIHDPSVLAAAAKDPAHVVYYDPATTSLGQLSQDIASVLHGQQADSIAFVNEGKPGQFSLTQDVSVSMATLQSSAGLQTFWHDVGTMVRDGGHVDLLACDVAATSQGVDAVNDIDHLVDASGKHIQVDASTDLTGNASSGGNWQLELGGVNAAPIYFNVAALSHWDGLLDSPTLTLENNPNQVVNENSGAQSVASFASSNGGAGVTYVVSDDNNPLFSAQPAIDANGNLTYTPAVNANGSTNVTVQAQDTNGDSDPQTFSITVNLVNQPPSFIVPPGTAVLESSINEAVTVSGFVTNISPGPGDPVTETVQFNVLNDDNPALFAVAPAIDSSGNLTYTLAADESGAANITVDAQNSGGTANGGHDTSASQSFAIDAIFVNQAPTFTLPDTSILVVENTGAHTVTSFATNIADGAGDPAGRTLNFAISGNSGDSNPALFSVLPSIDSSGNLTYTLAHRTGTATISVSLNDGFSISAVQEFTITAIPPPAAYDLPLPAGVQVDNALGGAMASVNGITYFIATDSNDSSGGAQPQIWATDGNQNGASVVTNFSTGSIGNLTAFNGALYFSVDIQAAHGASASAQLYEISGSTVTAIDGPAFQAIGDSGVGFFGALPQTAPFFTENNSLYFVGQTAAQGAEPYVVTDGTTVSLLMDINPGSGSSEASNFAVLDPTATTPLVVFSANDGVDGQQLWVTNGTGASMITDSNVSNGGINPGSPNVTSDLSYLGFLTEFTLGFQTEIASLGNNLDVFTANVGTSSAPDMQIWVTDGTTANTSEIADLGSDAVISMAAVNGKAVFSTDTDTWSTDGTSAGTSMIANGVVDVGNAAFNNELYFIGANSAGTNTSLYATDGTAAGTTLVSGSQVFTIPDNIALAAIGNSLFFSANDGVNGTQLWESSGSSVVLASDIAPGSASDPNNFVSNGQAVLFDVVNTTDGGLWTAGNSIQLNDQSYVAADDSTLSVNATNGLLNGVHDVNGEAFQVTPETIATANGSVTINADGSFSYTPDTGYLGPDSFSYQVTNTDGMVRTGYVSLNVEFVNQAPTFSLPNPDTAVFENSGAQGVANFATNIADGAGDPAGQPLTFVVSGDSNSALFSVAPSIDSSGNLTYTLASGEIGAATISVSLNDGISTSAVQEFTITADRTPVAYDLPLPAGVQVLSSVSVDGITFSEPMTSVNGITYFLATDPAHANPQIWETDGNLNGTSIVTNFPGGSIIGDLTAFNGALYFSVDSGIMGSASGQLYELSGTTVTAIGGAFGSIGNSGINASTGNIISESAPFFTENGLLYFVGETSALGAQVYTTDGTTTISSPLTDFNPSVSSNISGFTVVNNPTEGPLVIFSANDGVDGQQLWVTNGTTSSMLTDLNTANGGIDPGSTGFPLSAASSLSGINLLQIDIASLGNSAVFTANVGTSSAIDMQLWTTDGTTANTSEIMDFSNNAIISMTAVGNGNAIFSSTFGPSLAVWSTDGTATGTSIIANGVVDYGNASFNNEIYFIGLGTNAFTSLYATDGTAAGTVSVSPAGMFTFNFFSDAPPSLAAIGNSLFFSANDGAGDGNQLWASNGSSVVLVSDISPSGTDSNPQNFTNNGQALIFDVINTTDGGLWTAGNSIQLNDQSYSTLENQQVTENAANGLLHGAQDVNGEILQVTPETNAATANGSVTINADGSFIYTPNADYNGSDSFSYQVTNTDGTVRTATASINVEFVNQAPTFSLSNITIPENSPAQTVNTNLSTGPGDPASETVSFTSVTNDNNALFSVQPAIDASGNLTYTLASDASGSTTVTVVAQNSGGTDNGGNNTTSETFTIDVPANQPPIFTLPDTSTFVTENAGAHTVSGFATNIADGAGDLAGQPLTFVVTDNSNPALFSVAPAIDSSGNLTYTLASGETGTATISVSLNDGVSTSAVQEFTITGTPPAAVYDLPLPANVTVDNAPGMMASVNGITYFVATDSTNGNTQPQIWETDGNLNGTSVVTNFSAGSSIGDLTAFKGALYFSVDSASGGVGGGPSGQLDEISGTTVTVVEPGNAFIAIGSTGSVIGNTPSIFAHQTGPFFTENGLLYFIGQQSNQTGVFVTDGTTTSVLAGAVFEPGSNNTNFAIDFAAVNSPTGPKVLFSANDGFDGQQLWVTDGTPAGTSMLTDLNTANGGINPGSSNMTSNLSVLGSQTEAALANQTEIVSLGNFDVFTANMGTSSAPDMQLWRTDGTAAGTSEIMDFGNVSLFSMAAVNGKAIFSIFTGGYETWISDGTAAGTLTGFGDLGTIDIGNVSFNNELYFIGYHPTHGIGSNSGFDFGLYETDGTLVPIGGLSLTQVSTFSIDNVSLGVIGNSLFFSANAGDGNQLWQTYGVYSGVELAKDISPAGTDANPQNFTSNGQALIFDVSNTTDGGLWTAGNSIQLNDQSYVAPENGTLSENAANGLLNGAQDVNGESLQVTPESNVATANGSVTINADGSFSYTANVGYLGPDSFSYQVTNTDGTVRTGYASLNVNAVPVANNDSYTVVGSLAANTSILANDTDVNGLPFTPSVVSGPAHGTLTLNADGTFTYASTGGYVGPDSFTYKDTDAGGSSNVATVSLTVDQAPIATNDAYSVGENGVLNQAAPGVLANDTDPQGDTLTTTLTSSPSHGTLTLNADGSFNYTPAANYFGPDSFTYKVADGIQDSNGVVHSSNVATVNIAVGEAAPVANNDSYTVVGSLAANTSILANDTDINGLTFTPSVVTGPAHGTLTLNADGTFTYASTGGYVGPDSFTYKDTNGGGSSNVATVSLTVDQAPIAVNDAYSVNENGALSQAAPGVLANDTDPQGDTLTTTLTSSPSHGTLTLNADGSFNYTPAANYFGPDSFTYKVADGIQDSNGVVHSSNVATVNITVNFVNQAPSFTIPAAAPTVPENSGAQTDTNFATNISVGAGDPVSETVHFNVISDSNSSLFSVAPTISPSGTLTYTPGANETGTATITVDAQNSGGTANGGNDTSATKSFTITIQAESPVANNDAYNDFHLSGTAAAITESAAQGVLANDTDPNGLALTAQLLTGPSDAVKGSFHLNADGSFSYTAKSGFSGVDTFTYKASDGIFSSNTATVSINVDIIPVIKGVPATGTFVEGQLPIILSPSSSATHSTGYTNSDLTVSLLSNGTSTDVLSITTTSTITLSGNDVLYNGTDIGTYTGGTDLNPLIVTFNSSATNASVGKVMDAIAFSNSSLSPSMLSRTVQFQLTDSAGDSSSPLSTVVSIVDNPPTIGATSTNLDLVTGKVSKVGSLSGLTLTDADATGIYDISVQVQNGTLNFSSLTGLSLTFLNGTEPGSTVIDFQGTLAHVKTALSRLTYTSDAGYTGSDQLSINVTDGVTNIPADDTQDTIFLNIAK